MRAHEEEHPQYTPGCDDCDTVAESYFATHGAGEPGVWRARREREHHADKLCKNPLECPECREAMFGDPPLAFLPVHEPIPDPCAGIDDAVAEAALRRRGVCHASPLVDAYAGALDEYRYIPTADQDERHEAAMLEAFKRGCEQRRREDERRAARRRRARELRIAH